MLSNIWSLLAIPALVSIWVTSMFGLNDVRSPFDKAMLKVSGIIEFLIGLSFFATFVGSFLMLVAVVLGANIYTWRGTLLMCGIAGVFVFAGKFAPWKRFIRRLVDMERLEKRWKAEGRPSVTDMAELIADGRRALSMKGSQRIDECMRVLPKIVVALERTAAREAELSRIRSELSRALDDLKVALRSRQETDAYMINRVNRLLDELEGAIKHE